MAIEGLDGAVEERYEVLRDADFLRKYAPAPQVAQYLEQELIKESSKTRTSLERLGIKVAELSIAGSIREYLRRLKEEDRGIRDHFGLLAMLHFRTV